MIWQYQGRLRSGKKSWAVFILYLDVAVKLILGRIAIVVLKIIFVIDIFRSKLTENEPFFHEYRAMHEVHRRIRKWVLQRV